MRKLLRESSGCRCIGKDVASHRHDLRLHKALICGSSRRKLGDSILSRVKWVVIVGDRADRDDVGDVARRIDAQSVRAAVAGRGDHYYPRAPRGHHGLVERIVPVRRVRRSSQGQVQYADAVPETLINDPLDPANDVEVASRAVAVQHPHRDDRYTGGNTLIVTACGQAAAGDNRGDVRAVAEWVVNFVIVLVGPTMRGRPFAPEDHLVPRNYSMVSDF